MVVIDANVAAALVVNLPWSKEARTEVLRDPNLIAPDLFTAELANVLWQNARNGALSQESALLGLHEIASIVSVRPSSEISEDALRMGMINGHSVYDCLYLALAMRERISLLTADRKLAALAKTMRTPVRLLL